MAFKYNKVNRKVDIFCPNCNSDLSFQIPSNVLEKKYNRYPFTFRYVHGNPPHSCTLYIDKNGVIRGHEFGDSVSLSNEFILDLIEQKNLNKRSSTEIILKSMINIFYFTIETAIPNSDEIKYNIGKQIGNQIAKLLESTEIDSLIEEIKEFWEFHGFGMIKDFRKEGEVYKMKVFDCYECRDMPNMGKPVCKVDKGVFEEILTIKLKKNFFLREIACLAMGNECCEFEIIENDNDNDPPF